MVLFSTRLLVFILEQSKSPGSPALTSRVWWGAAESRQHWGNVPPSSRCLSPVYPGCCQSRVPHQTCCENLLKKQTLFALGMVQQPEEVGAEGSRYHYSVTCCLWKKQCPVTLTGDVSHRGSGLLSGFESAVFSGNGSSNTSSVYWRVADFSKPPYPRELNSIPCLNTQRAQ